MLKNTFSVIKDLQMQLHAAFFILKLKFDSYTLISLLLMFLVELTADWSVLVNWSVLVLTRRVARSVAGGV